MVGGQPLGTLCGPCLSDRALHPHPPFTIGVEEQLEVTKKNLEQFQEICNSNESALTAMTKQKEDQVKNHEKSTKTSNDAIKKLHQEIKQHTNTITALKRNAEVHTLKKQIQSK